MDSLKAIIAPTPIGHDINVADQLGEVHAEQARLVRVLEAIQLYFWFIRPPIVRQRVGPVGFLSTTFHGVFSFLCAQKHKNARTGITRGFFASLLPILAFAYSRTRTARVSSCLTSAGSVCDCCQYDKKLNQTCQVLGMIAVTSQALTVMPGE